MSRRNQELKFVWPKDGIRGSRKRGFFRGFSDILNGKGPDMFLQKGGQKAAIAPDRWGNWDTYHDYDCHLQENVRPLRSVLLGRREYNRYDPVAREYVQWGHPEDWNNNGIRNNGRLAVPRFTEDERRKIYPRVSRGRMPDPAKMGNDWNAIGPKRWRPEHNWFWSSAHRIGGNNWDNVPKDSVAWPYRWGQSSATNLVDWVNQEF